jgi:myo-inositol-1(or 4)-monophosphatase
VKGRAAIPDADAERALAASMEIAREAGALLIARMGPGLEVERKGAIDLVTAADRASEAHIVARLRALFPGDAILAEEGGGGGAASRRRWLVDPLDGTTNYAHGYPFFSVSIALEVEGRVACGVVHDPVRGETFAARRGGGASCNGAPLRVSTTTAIDAALLVTGFPYSIRDQPEPTVGLLRAFLLAAQGIRRDGSAALDLCYLAAGRFDGYWELDLKPWDVAAGSLIVEEAGGRVTKLDGTPFTLDGRSILATNHLLHERMREIARATLR